MCRTRPKQLAEPRIGVHIKKRAAFEADLLWLDYCQQGRPDAQGSYGWMGVVSATVEWEARVRVLQVRPWNTL